MSERIDIERIRAYCEKASAGPWKAVQGPLASIAPPSPKENAASLAVYDSKPVSYYGLIPQGILFRTDAEFIANARTDLPAAISELSALRKENERLKEEVTALEIHKQSFTWPESVLRIRCIKHLSVPQQNSNEHSGGECGACIAESRDRLQAEVEGVRKSCQLAAREFVTVENEARDLRAQLELAQAKEELEEEGGRWQKAIYELCCEETKSFPDINIDGAGCESGDPLDVTLSEIRQALAAWQDKQHDTATALASCREVAGEMAKLLRQCKPHIEGNKNRAISLAELTHDWPGDELLTAINAVLGKFEG